MQVEIDITKYRKISSFANSDGDFERTSIVQQTIDEFDLYLKYAPNRHTIYINDDPKPVWAVFQDVSDLEIRTDSKWMLTSLQHKINVGDIFTWDSRKWMCIYDKEKNTANCNKVKVQPCNYIIKLPYFNTDNTPSIYNADSIIMTYLTDMKEFKQPFPSESGTTFITVQFNDYTNKIKRQDRIWLYDSAFDVVGVDFTNIDFYKNKGFLKWTLRPDKIIEDLDNKQLGVCDYYKYFNKPNTNYDNTDSNGSIVINIDSNKVNRNSEIIFTVSNVPLNNKVDFSFVGNNYGCVLTPTSSNSCKLETRSQIGFVTVRANLVNDTIIYDTKRILIE